MTCKNTHWVKNTSHKKPHIASFHLHEIQELVKISDRNWHNGNCWWWGTRCLGESSVALQSQRRDQCVDTGYHGPQLETALSPTEEYLESATKFNQTLKKQARSQHLEGNYSQDFSLLFSGLFFLLTVSNLLRSCKNKTAPKQENNMIQYH